MVHDEVGAEQIDEVFLQLSPEAAREAVLDGGAQSFVVGNRTLEKYAELLRIHGIDWTPTTLPCDKMFRFGNDATCHCKTAVVLPVNFAGRTGHLQVYLLEGTPRSFSQGR